ncbi:MAG: archaellin/type IV pilin N-terminal domain-containing protein [Candidatus Bathyarchaeia archaeon]
MPGILMMYRGRSGISPVVATVILVAIAIVIAIAVAFWATGLVGIFTRYEKIEITAAVYDTTRGNVELLIRNTGSSPATIDAIYVNGQPGAPYTILNQGNVVNPPQSAPTCEISSATTAICDPGEYVVISVQNPAQGAQWAHGVTYEVAVHSASGKLYPVAVLIP